MKRFAPLVLLLCLPVYALAAVDRCWGCYCALRRPDNRPEGDCSRPPKPLHPRDFCATLRHRAGTLSCTNAPRYQFGAAQ
jgi:hypothetical protein